jgi:hypothetical protein
MNGVIPSKGMLLSEISGRPDHITCYLDAVEMSESILQGALGIVQVMPGQPS